MSGTFLLEPALSTPLPMGPFVNICSLFGEAILLDNKDNI